MRKLVVIDGNSVAYRAFFALPALSNSSGLHTGAVYGMTTMLLRLIEEEKPTHFLAAFDAGKVTFRHSQYGEYKGGRQKTPPELSEQFPVIRNLIEAMGIRQFELEGYEADDIIGTITKLAEQDDVQAVVVTGDKDMLQLASERVTIALTRKGVSEIERFDPAHIREVYNLAPDQIRDLKGLMGDASDNIPGVPGVGEKTALKLLHEYGTVEQVLAHVDELKGKLRENIANHADDARMSKELATIFREVPMEADWDALRFAGPDKPKLAELFRKLEFRSLIDKLDLGGGAGAEPAESDEQEEALEVVRVTADRLGDLVKRLGEVKAFAAEVTGDNPHTGDVHGLTFLAGQTAYYVPFGLLASDEASALREWLADPEIPKITHDAHRTEVALHWRGLPLRGVAFCTMLAGYLLDPTEAGHTLGLLARKYECGSVPENEDVYGKGAKFKVPDEQTLAAFGARRALAISRLESKLSELLKQNGMESLYHELELPLSGRLAAMETTGVRVDAGALEAYGEELKQSIARLEKDIYELAGTEFNIGSTKQLGEILFDKLKLPVVKKTKTGYSTDAEVLEKLEPYHDIVKHILHYRQLTKLQSTYIEGLLKEVRPETGKIHTYYQQTIAATGRLSSQFPNLQNIPIRLEEGRKIRRVFVPSEPGWVILAADYSQIELRVLAHISGDEGLKEAFRTGLDVHTKTAMDVFGVSEDQVDANMRRQAKAVNFGIVYGISGFGLSRNLDISPKEAEAFIKQYYETFPGVRAYMDNIVATAREQGYVTTLLNRRRYLPEIKASNFNLRSFAERTAMNTPIQGTAADIIKLAMVKIADRLESEGLSSRMLLTVHDELVFEVPPDELETMKRLVPEVMESALELDVPLKVDVSWGDNWYEAK
ncbi:DNA polymerase I [Paenibacillus thermoaerophilus]|uniref:DNA polymerase I n=1 Tax=Paenibacillus thermoaerophilus TaxID=1215385 RepID=A0ABW2V2R6_9BACL|nr:DNA polymerase I [Paenibacillus thermoaerophilus]TMV15979.1 DNA polymerase I [Paenibacillus thermoaerophilus]